MKTISFILSTIVLLLFTAIQGQCQSGDPVMLNIAGEEITRNEFMKVFEKNNNKNEVIDNKALEEYLDLFINFRLKVTEARALGMDTVKSFIDELAGYRKQLAAPYLVDNQKTEKLLSEAYERMKYDVRVSHILIKVDRLASAADTLAAWNKITALRKRIIQGEDFGKVAAEASDDPSARPREAENQKIKGNNGDLGFFTALDMVYAFESAAYTAKINEVSMPVRTDFGYHLIKVTDRIPAMGKVQLAHIYMVFPEKATAQDSLNVADSIKMAYNMIKNGTDFAEVVKKFSDDQSTSAKGGVLPWFGVSRMLPDFVLNIQKIRQKGDYSQPFQTVFGWHIIKLSDQKPIGSYEDEKEEVKKRIAKNDRNNEIQRSYVEKTKTTYGFTANPSALDELIKTVSDSIFTASWKAEEAAGLNKPLFTIGTTTYKQGDFAKYLAATQRRAEKKDITAYVNQKYNIFVSESVVKYADSQLEAEYPDFKALMKEYHDGILLFDLTDSKVWSKAVKDTVGLQKFYETNKNNYLWDTRLDASIFTIKDPSIVKSLSKMLNKGTSEGEILAKFNNDSIMKIKIEHKKFVKGENMALEGIEWKPGISELKTLADNEQQLIQVHKVVPPEPKLLNEARGLITSDYQNFLEKEWLAELRAKYPVKVNHEVFQTLLKN